MSKSKYRAVEEILENISPEKLQEFVKGIVYFDSFLANAIIARFGYLANLSTKSSEAKYNAIFRFFIIHSQQQKVYRL